MDRFAEAIYMQTVHLSKLQIHLQPNPRSLTRNKRHLIQCCIDHRVSIDYSSRRDDNAFAYVINHGLHRTTFMLGNKSEGGDFRVSASTKEEHD
jgi:hypothetical protein